MKISTLETLKISINRTKWENVCNYLEENNIEFIPGPDGIYVPDFKDKKLLKRYIEYYEAYMEELVKEVIVEK